MMDLVNAVWGRHVLSCWYTKPSIRLDDYLCGQVLGVDWDDETHVSSLDVVSQLTLVSKCAAVVYSTQSSRPAEGKHRTRALFCLEEPVTNPEDHRIFARALSGFLLGGRQETNPNRMFHGTGEEGTIILLGNILPMSIIRGIAEDWEAWEYKPEQDSGPVEITGETPTRIANALRMIPPTCPYDEWTKVCMAVHSAYPDELGVALIEAWAPGYRGEVKNKFKSFRAGKGVTLKSLFHIANQYRR